MSFQLNSLSSKELYKDVLVRLVHGNALTLNYFELKNQTVKIPFHIHPVEHLVVVLKGTALTNEGKALLKQKNQFVLESAEWKKGQLYRPLQSVERVMPDSGTLELELIPYYAWANRGLAYMDVWMPLAN